MDSEVYHFTVILVGDSDVGKTAFLRRFTESSFTTDMHSTIGMDLRLQDIEVDGRKAKLEVRLSHCVCVLVFGTLGLARRRKDDFQLIFAPSRYVLFRCGRFGTQPVKKSITRLPEATTIVHRQVTGVDATVRTE